MTCLPRLLLAAALALAAPALQAQSPNEPGGAAQPAPYQLLRTLQSLQNEAAAGNRAAHAAQARLLRDIDQAMLAQAPQVWSEARNARALVQYVLSGGQPGVLAQALKGGQLAGIPKELAEGALAYLSGDMQRARTLLMPLDPATLHESLAGQVALVQATAVMRDDPKRALQLLDQARLLAPGSLVEEGALRRTVSIAAETGELDRLEKATSQYMRRFARSVYAESFRQSFAAGLFRFEIGRDPDKLPRLVAVLRAFDREEQRAVLLVVARDALIHGRFEQARRTAEEVAQRPGSDQATVARASFYKAAAQLGLDAAKGAAEALKRVDPLRLPPADRDILQVARAVAAQIGDAAAPAPAPASGATQSSAFAPQTQQLLTRAEQSLAQAETLLAVDAVRKAKP